MRSKEYFLSLRRIYLGSYAVFGYALLGEILWAGRGTLFDKLPEIFLMIGFLAFATFLDFPVPKQGARIQFIYPVYILGILLLREWFVVPYVALDFLVRLWEEHESYLATAWNPVRMVPVILLSTYLYERLGGAYPRTLGGIHWLAFAGLVVSLAVLDGLSMNISETLRTGNPPWRFILPLVAYFDVPFTPLALPLYLLYRNEGAAVLVVFSLPFIAVCWLVRQFLIRTAEKEESLGLLNMANELISSSLDFDVMVRKIAARVKESMSADRVELFLTQDGKWSMQFADGITREDEDLSGILNHRIGPDPVVIRDLREEPGFSSYKSAGFFSILLIPLFSGSEIAGCLVCAKQVPDFFFSQHVAFSRIFSGQVSAALYGARLHRQLSTTLLELRETQAKLVHAEKMGGLGKMAAGVAHEINNPLGAILLNAEALKANRGDEATLEILLEAAQQCKSIVDRLLRFSRQASTPEETVFPLEEIVQEGIAIWKKQLELDRIEVRMECEGKPYATGKPQEFTQVLFNLLSNARDAIRQKNEPSGMIRVRVSAEKNESVLEVSDNGCGIKPETLPRIFEPFFTTKNVGAGTGLGLSISYGIVSSMGGTISASSDPEKGTTFTVKLPTRIRQGFIPPSSPDKGKGDQEGEPDSTRASEDRTTRGSGEWLQSAVLL